jgi:ribosomal protein S18 acetylase RimI-like enzyme
MEYKLLEENEISLMGDVLKDDNMIFNEDFLRNFIKSENNYGFIAKEDNKVVGFAYAYALLRPDGRTMFYLHSIGMLPEYQNQGYGTELMKFIKEFAINNGCSEMFVLTDRGNPRACHVYEKLGGKNDYEDEVCYVYDFEG